MTGTPPTPNGQPAPPNGARQPDLPQRQFLKAREVAQITGLGLSTVYQLVYRRQLPARKIGKALRFHRDDVDQFMRTLPPARP